MHETPTRNQKSDRSSRGVVAFAWLTTLILWTALYALVLLAIASGYHGQLNIGDASINYNFRPAGQMSPRQWLVVAGMYVLFAAPFGAVTYRKFRTR